MQKKLNYPITTKNPKITKIHNEELTDNYYWLREKEDTKVINYLKKENDFTEKILKSTKNLQTNLFNELKERIKETDITVPEKIDDYYYYSKTEKGKQYSIYCRKKDSLNNKEEIILNINELAEGHDFFQLETFSISENHEYIAYSIDISGDEVNTIYIKNINTGNILEQTITGTGGAIVWANDNETIYYTTLDHIRRPYKLFSHKINQKKEKDVLLFEEKDERFILHAYKTKSKKYIIMALASVLSTESHYIHATGLDNNFKCIREREPDLEYTVEHHNDHFYIVTNENAQNFKLVKTPVKNPAKKNWVDVIPHNSNIKIDFADPFKNHIVIYARENGLKTILIKNLQKTSEHYVKFKDPIYSYEPHGNRNFHSNILRFTYTSLKTSDSVYDYNMDTKEQILKKQDEVLGGYKAEDYITERIFAESVDGTLIPISLLYKKDIALDGKNPLFLYGYGSYGICLDPEFEYNIISLVNRGFVYAVCHIRGGGELGRQWYENGKFLKKKNSFLDFKACAEHLIKEKYTSKKNIVANGRSAGGLLMGAAANLCPELFKAIIAEVPFLDSLNTMLDPTLPLTVNEYAEWGDPNKKEYYDYMKSYAPYENIEKKDYPHFLAIGSLNDSRVAYWEPAKFIAKLREFKTDNNLAILKTIMNAGHGGASGRYDSLKEDAFKYAFILYIFGINE